MGPTSRTSDATDPCLRAVRVLALLLLGLWPALAAAQPCPPGHQGPDGSAPCTLCPAGSVQILPGQSACELCPAGSISLPSRVYCYPCETGTAAPSAGSSECTPCGPGEYTNFDGTVECLICPPGTASNGTGASNCACGEDQFQPEAGQEYCLDCPAGTHSFLPTSLQCITCQPRVGRLRLKADKLLALGHSNVKLVADLLLADPAGFGALDLTRQDAVVTVRGAGGALLVTERFHPSTYSGPGTRGWTVNRRRTKWRYRDENTPSVTGIGELTIVDRGRSVPGRIRVTFTGKDGLFLFRPSYLPFEVRLAIGAEGEHCLTSVLLNTECRFDRRANRLRCRQH